MFKIVKIWRNSICLLHFFDERIYLSVKRVELFILLISQKARKINTLPIEIRTDASNLITGQISTSYSYYGRISTSSSYSALNFPLKLFFYWTIHLGILISRFFIVFHLLCFKKLLALSFLNSIINLCFFSFFGTIHSLKY